MACQVRLGSGQPRDLEMQERVPAEPGKDEPSSGQKKFRPPLEDETRLVRGFCISMKSWILALSLTLIGCGSSELSTLPNNSASTSISASSPVSNLFTGRVLNEQGTLVSATAIAIAALQLARLSRSGVASER